MIERNELRLFDILERNPESIPENLRSATSEQWLEFIEGLLLTDSADPLLLSQIETAALNMTEMLGEDILGAVYFLLFSNYAEIFGENGDHSKNAKATRLINHLDTKRFLHTKYDIPQTYLQYNFNLYKVGTTSFIITIENKYVLKLLKYRYRNNLRIASATKAYKDRFGGLGNFAPVVHESAEHFIIMDFVAGKTLREYVDETGRLNIRDVNNAISHIKTIENIINQLLIILSELHKREKPVFHMDLNADNIILRTYISSKDLNVVLIDFGYNYILQEKIGTPNQILAAQVSIAPELNDSPNFATGRSDLYSLGILLLSMLTGKAGQRSDVDSQLDQIWQEYPEFGGVIESVLEAEPQNRLPEKLSQETDYEFLSRQMTSAFKLFCASHLEGPYGWRKIISNLPMSGQPRRVFELARQYKAVYDIPDLAKEIRRLLCYSILTQFAQVVILIVAFFYLLDDFGVKDINQRFLVRNIREFLGVSDLSPGTWHENIWGRLVGITFSIVAVRYYQNIHSRISARGISQWTEFWLRFNSFCFALPILWLMVVKPSHWPFSSFVGVLFVAFNNYSTAAAARTSLQKIMLSLRLPISVSRFEEFFEMYESYALNSAIYSIALLIGGFILAFGLAKDERIYALAVSFVINLGVIYVSACTKKAPAIRGNLMRLYEGCRRSQLIQTKRQR